MYSDASRYEVRGHMMFNHMNKGGTANFRPLMKVFYFLRYLDGGK